MIEVLKARKYYGPHAVGCVLLVDGHPWHFTGTDSFSAAKKAEKESKQKERNAPMRHINPERSTTNAADYFAAAAERAARGRRMRHFIIKKNYSESKPCQLCCAGEVVPSSEVRELTLKEKKLLNAQLEQEFLKKLKRNSKERPRLQYWEVIPSEKKPEKKLWEP